jgi:V8-like Glu-specific endopeptidase
LLGTPAPSAYPQAADTDAAIRQVVVWNPERGARARLGTAFHLGGGIFYTAAHVARAKVPEGFTQLYLAAPTSGETPESWLGPLTVSCVHPHWRGARDDSTRAYPYDVAQLRLQTAPELPSLSLDIRNPQEGRAAIVKGFPAASRGWPPPMYTARGRIDEVDGGIQAFSVAIQSGFALGGSSGSPVLGDDGRVLGMVFGALNIANRSATELVIASFAKTITDGCPARP